ncbi:HlyC/CorC family transporter [Peptostreptococcus porci]|uniref:HlyC/CorC family transporter n=1 Tax=Peptostreptococcus porci TaxID=2652282 RepID=UPI0023F2F891|nr:hemolysin family protein [Peptostreptococcus porci]MDD7182284.1 hemolysin family protein [Peptostreptococcus porci]MDY5437074.1 hemolysin family protein [Peptostreptococcus porci]MDY5964133.1 hemolysin family protein [Peptostreptococcus porci]MDY6231684.1 hemolysin family protein [Peptostreptococcus porci]
MESGSLWIQVIILLVLMIISAFFSASETALMSVSKVKIRHLREEGVRGASVVEKLISEPKKLLSTILVGNNVVNIAATSISTSLLLKLFGAQGVAVATAMMTVLILVFGEVTPKTMASNNKERVSLGVAKVLNVIILVLSPIVFILNLFTTIIFKIFRIKDDDPKSLITEEDLKVMVNVSHEEGVLEQEEREIINNVFEFGDMRAEDAMIQRIDMVSVSVDATFDEVLEIFKEEKKSRLPVYKENIDDIVGILNIKDVFFISKEEIETFSVEKYMRDVFFTYEFKKISQLLEEMKLAKTQIAIVLDEYGGTSGLLTVEDLVEVLVGDIEDEYDEEDDEIVKVGEGEYIVDGSTKITDVNDYLYDDLESDEFDSIGGYILGHLNGLPDEGEVIELNDSVTVNIISLDKNRIEKLKLIVREIEKQEDEISFKEYIEKENSKDND